MAVVGSGFGGVGAAIKLLEVGITDLTIFERNEGVGVSGKLIDIPAVKALPSHLYSFLRTWHRMVAPLCAANRY